MNKKKADLTRIGRFVMGFLCAMCVDFHMDGLGTDSKFQN